MAKKYIDIMDTTFRDGFQSVFGGHVLMDDFFPAVEAAKNAGINHFEFGGGTRFHALFSHLKENAFDMMDGFREIVGKEANLQVVSRGINTVMSDTSSREMIELFAKLFAKHGTTTVRNFDALNDVSNLEFSAEMIKKYGMSHEAVVTMMDLPSGIKGAHDVAFYEKTLRNILDSGITFDSICFKDASGTVNPHKVYETIAMARKLLGDSVHLRLHTHETSGISVAAYLAALEAGANGIDMAASPVSGGTSQPDILTMLHATKGTNYNLGDLKLEKVLKYEERLKACLNEYMIPTEATQVSPLIPFSPMPGGALTENMQAMRESGDLEKFDEVVSAMKEVVKRGGYGTSVRPVSQFYWQQAYANVMFGPWEQIDPGYGRMVLGYFGKTPIEADKDIMELAAQKLNLEPTSENPLDIADRDETKSIAYWTKVLEEEGLKISDENIFIAGACDENGIAFLKGETPLKVKKGKNNCSGDNKMAGNYTVVVDGKQYSVQVAEGEGDIQIAPASTTVASAPVATPASEAAPVALSGTGSIEINSQTPGNVWKILKSPGDTVAEGDIIMILEAMKMEIDIAAPQAGKIVSINVNVNDTVADAQLLATME
ncbi:Pyruvate carboxylase subunit B (biotin-containing) [hydrothermal vent metagenome]|uniref:Pyruvate carboxylase subunit B (Biotin-containing) n=1 Tax=hydrothermal vent metagenome TaxID=652676 RepID=A0A1W1BIA3_9ZZZZ